MSSSKKCVLWIALSCLSGCAYSIHPVATQEVIVDEPDLSGTWKTLQPEKGIRVGIDAVVCNKMGKERPGAYLLKIEGETGDKTPMLRAQLLKLGDIVYLEVSLVDTQQDQMPAKNKTTFYKLYRIEVDKNELSVFISNDPAVLNTARKERLGVVKKDNEWVITASSLELQQFYRDHGDEFFGKKSTFRVQKQHLADHRQ
jgi:hypothetical protein